MAILWAASAVEEHKLKSVRFELSSPEAAAALNNPLVYPSTYSVCHEILWNIYVFSKSSMYLVSRAGNLAAYAITESVISCQRLQSYVASGGPRWLAMLLQMEATSS